MTADELRARLVSPAGSMPVAPQATTTVLDPPALAARAGSDDALDLVEQAAGSRLRSSCPFLLGPAPGVLLTKRTGAS